MNFKWEGVPSSLIKCIAFVGDQVQTQIAVQFHNGKNMALPPAHKMNTIDLRKHLVTDHTSTTI